MRSEKNWPHIVTIDVRWIYLDDQACSLLNALSQLPRNREMQPLWGSRQITDAIPKICVHKRTVPSAKTNQIYHLSGGFLAFSRAFADQTLSNKWRVVPALLLSDTVNRRDLIDAEIVNLLTAKAYGQSASCFDQLLQSLSDKSRQALVGKTRPSLDARAELAQLSRRRFQKGPTLSERPDVWAKILAELS